jgi:hypothetical protein
MTKKAEVYTDIKVVPISSLVHNDQNPRIIKDRRFRDLKKSLKEFPEMKKLREIVVDEKMLILAGDKRTLALKDLGYSDVEVKQVFNLTEEQKRRFIAVDNEHWGEWDADAIANLWGDDALGDWGIEGISFAGFGEDTPDTPDEEKKAKRVLCPCGCEYVFNVRGNEFTE